MTIEGNRTPRTFSLAAGIIGCCLFSFSVMPISQADTLTLGFREFPNDLDLLRSHELVAQVARAGIVQTLVNRNDGPLPYRLGLADSMSVGADRKMWSFRIRSGAKFHDGHLVGADDVVFSLNRCAASGELSSVARIEARRVDRAQGGAENWVDVGVDETRQTLSDQAASGEQPPRKAGFSPVALSNCPVIERSSSELFGSVLGTGSNLVSLGAYFISDFSSGREITLNKYNQVSQEGASQIVLRGFKDSLHGLTALRSGTVDALFEPSQEVIEKAQKDQTLELVDCLSGKLVLRRGFEFNCKAGVNLSKLRYIG